MLLGMSKEFWLGTLLVVIIAAMIALGRWTTPAKRHGGWRGTGCGHNPNQNDDGGEK